MVKLILHSFFSFRSTFIWTKPGLEIVELGSRQKERS